MKTLYRFNLILIIFFTWGVYSQNNKQINTSNKVILSEIKVDGVYISSLTDFFDDIQNKYGINIIFDREKF